MHYIDIYIYIYLFIEKIAINCSNKTFCVFRQYIKYIFILNNKTKKMIKLFSLELIYLK